MNIDFEKAHSYQLDGTNLTVESWTEERIAEAYEAVMAIINRIAIDSGVDTLFALMLFMEVFDFSTHHITKFSV